MFTGNTVLIDRRTKWGNPFRICSGQNAEQAVARYRVHLWERIRAGEVTLEDLAELESCWLACWCSGDGHPCHGEVLERAAAWASDRLAQRDARRATHGRGSVMSAVPFRRIAPDESRIYRDGDHVGDVVRQEDVLSPGSHFYMVHLDEDPRGPCRVHDRSRICEMTERLVGSHPLWG